MPSKLTLDCISKLLQFVNFTTHTFYVTLGLDSFADSQIHAINYDGYGKTIMKLQKS